MAMLPARCARKGRTARAPRASAEPVTLPRGKKRGGPSRKLAALVLAALMAASLAGAGPARAQTDPATRTRWAVAGSSFRSQSSSRGVGQSDSVVTSTSAARLQRVCVTVLLVRLLPVLGVVGQTGAGALTSALSVPAIEMPAPEQLRVR